MKYELSISVNEAKSLITAAKSYLDNGDEMVFERMESCEVPSEVIDLVWDIVHIVYENANKAYRDGYDDGHADGKTVGDQIGYNEGHRHGYNEGYRHGQEDCQMDDVL